MKKKIVLSVLAAVVAVLAYAVRTAVKGADAAGKLFTPVKN